MAERKNYPLRLDPEVYEALRIWADDELRSVNAQIEYVLRQSVQKRKSAGSAPPPNGSGDEGPTS